MRVTIDRCAEEPLDRFLSSRARNALPDEQSSDGAEELQIDQCGSIDISLAAQADSNRAIGALVKESANPGARIGNEHSDATSSDQLLELSGRQTAASDHARTCQRFFHRGAGGLTDQYLPCISRQRHATLYRALAKSLKRVVRHVSYLKRRCHDCILACRMHATSWRAHQVAIWAGYV